MEYLLKKLKSPSDVQKMFYNVFVISFTANKIDKLGNCQFQGKHQKLRGFETQYMMKT